jgi:glycosyltransferase involved in cell wall biosynthesis
VGPLSGRRIAVVNWRDRDHSQAGGAEIYAWELARALERAGARVWFVTAREPHQSAQQDLDGIRIVRRGGWATFYVWALWWLVQHRRRLEAVVDADCGIPVFSPLVLRRRTPVVLLVHHVHLDQFGTYFSPLLALVGRVLERRVMPRVYRRSTVVAVSASTREEMVERLGWTGRIELLHNGTTLPAAPTPGAGVPGRVVVLGRLAPHKRVDDVVRAVGLLRQEVPEVELHVVGRGAAQELVEETVSELGLQDRVHVHGFLDQEDKEQLVASGRLHVCASDAEGWGQVVLEAAALGVPTLARDVPGLRDSVLPGRTGWLLDESDPRDLPVRLAEGIRAALRELDDEGRRREVVQQSRQWAAQHTWEAMHARAVDLLEGVVTASPTTLQDTHRRRVRRL